MVEGNARLSQDFARFVRDAAGNFNAMYVRNGSPETPPPRGGSFAPAALACGWLALGLFGAAYMFGYIADPVPAKQEIARIEASHSPERFDRVLAELQTVKSRIANLENAMGPVTSALPSQAPAENAAPRAAQPVQIAMAPLPAQGFGDEAAAFTALPIASGGITKTQFAIAVAVTEKKESLRGNWRDLLGRHGKTLEGLEPRIVAQVTRRGERRWKLVAGPFTNAAGAARACARLKSEKRPCAETVFSGEAL